MGMRSMYQAMHLVKDGGAIDVGSCVHGDSVVEFLGFSV